jgi:uncharacterized membrane protein
MTAALVAVVLVVNGLAAGVLMGTVLGGVPLLLALPPSRYVHAHAFFATRYDPFMPACLLLTVVGDVALTVVAGGVVTALAAAFALATVVISLTRNVPINKWVRSLDPDDLPGDFDDPRTRWKRSNDARTACAVAALLCNVVAVATMIA